MIQVVSRWSVIAKARFQNRVVHWRFVMDEVAFGRSLPLPEDIWAVATQYYSNIAP
jgi:hypothetical protein